ncbi:hypothetical protein, partial [Agathobaculum sp.]|uniref:hypothetical protein n=1 Tax=Agathobaculum sp. TaxID=2048138 RepID=UPI003AEFCF73
PGKLSFSLKVRKPRYTPPVFWNLLRKFNLIRAQSARKRHAKGVPFAFLHTCAQKRYPLPYSDEVGTGRAGLPQQAALNSP